MENLDTPASADLTNYVTEAIRIGDDARSVTGQARKPEPSNGCSRTGGSSDATGTTGPPTFATTASHRPARGASITVGRTRLRGHSHPCRSACFIPAPTPLDRRFEQDAVWGTVAFYLARNLCRRSLVCSARLARRWLSVSIFVSSVRRRCS
ncbi:hypothetical protein CFN78_00025 [Amycolatopsis antarctica]|uniref:Uncharacterized protein n=1 Tax=Amycolatopsis antarctica TaxID=1854586 RepID=A0A263D908_9PSEU|nr:hypothetical protein CFN78_00025 [Amycolatopsis antarctica]